MTFKQNVSGSDAVNLKTLTFKDCGTVDMSAATAAVSNLNLVFDGATTRTTTFKPGTTSYKGITNKNITLDFEANRFTQNDSLDFKIESGTVKAGTGGFTGGNLIVSGGTFEQTGTAIDSVNNLTISGSGTITWDKNSDGGSLEIKGTVSEQDGKTISYNKKSVTFQNNTTITGVFWDLIIPAGKEITNGGTIRVRRHFTIEGSYINTDGITVLGLDTTNPNKDDNENGIVTNDVTSPSTPSNLGKVIINKGTTTPATTLTTGSNLSFTDVNIRSGTFVSDKTLSVQNFEIESNGTFTNTSNGIVNVSKNFTDNGTYSSDGTGKIIFNGTTDQTFAAKNNSTYSSVEEEKNTGILEITGNPSITTFTLIKGTTTTFEGTPVITTFTDDFVAPGDNGKIIFSNGGSITSAVTFNTTNEVSITGPMNIGASPSYANLSHLTGDTKINGTLNAAQIILGKTSGTTTITSGTIKGSKFEVGNLNTEGQITTSSEQKYNGTVALTNELSLKSNTSSITFAQTITGAQPLSAESSAGTIFGGDVGTQTTPLASLSVAGPVILTTTPATHKIFANEISFGSSSTISGETALEITSSTGTTFGANVGTQTTPLSSLTVTGPSTISCSNIYTSGTQSFGGDVILAEDVTLNTNDTTNGNISFGSKVDSKSDETHSVTINIPTQRTAEFIGKVGETTAPSVLIDQAGAVSFSETVKAENITINEADNTTFDKTVTITTFTDDLLAPGDNGKIIFSNGGSITNAVTFNTTNEVSITGPMTIGTSSSYANISHLTGNTTINGTLNAAQITLGTTLGTSTGTTTITSGTIKGSKFEVGNLNAEGQITTSSEQKYNGTVALTNALSLKSNTSSITFAQEITGAAQTLSAESSAGTTFGGDVGTQTTPLASLTVTGPSTISCSNIYTSGTQSFGGDVILAEDVTLNTNDTTNGNISFGSKVDSKSGETHSVTIKIPTQRSAVFTGKVGETTAPSVIIDQAGAVSFNETVKAVNFTINKADNTTFDETVDINTFADDTTHTGNIIFKSGADIATATHLYTTGDITLTGTLTVPSLEINKLIVDGTAAIETTGATGTQTYHGTINGKTDRTDILTLNSGSDITFDAGIGQSTALKTLTVTGPVKLNNNIAVTADTVKLNTSLGSTTSAVRNLTVKDCNTLTNPTAASTVSNVDFIFTGAADRQTSFNPGASEYLNITTDTIELDLGNNAFNQNSASDFKITSGTVKAGTGGLTAGNLIVSGGDFIQTGAATDQVNDISLSGGSITWDSASQGGSLTINGVVTEASGFQINYNKKSVTFTHDNTISGIFWNLTIDSGRTITNGGSIRVRKDFTIDGTYVHNNKPIIFGLDLDAPETDSTENGTITDNASSNIGKAYINKGASYKQTAATNLLFKNLEITTGTFENPDTITTGTEILTNTTAGSISNAGTLNVTSSFTDNGTYTGTGLLKFTGTSAQTFAPGISTYSNIENTSADPLTVSRDIKATNFEIKSGKSTTFEGTTEVTNLTLTSADATTFAQTAQITNLTITDASETTFDQAVTITNFDDTNHTGNITFKTNATISTATEIHTPGIVTLTGTLTVPSLIMNNLVIDGAAVVTTTGIQTYNGTINDSTAGTNTLTLNSGTSQINFASDIGQTKAPKILTVNGPVAINCAKVTTTDEQNYNAAITSTGSITLKSNAINLDCATVTTNGSQTYDGPVALLSDTTLTSDTGDIHLKSPLTGEYKFKVAKANDATFDGAVTVTDFEITLANDTLFKQPVTITNFKITQANDTQFEKSVQISNFTDAATAGNISFNEGGTISKATGTTFNTNGIVTFGDNQSDIMTFGNASPYADLKHTSGNTSITGLINAADITLAQTAGGPMTIANSGLFKTVDGAALTYTTSFAQNGLGNSVIGGSFAGNGNASFATNVQLYGTSQADFGSSGKNISIAKNLIIIRDATDDLNINSNVSVTQNLVLYKGPVVADGNITAGSDILVLGSAYSEKDTSTGITDEYSYYCVRPSTWSQPNYTETLLPDGISVPEPVEGALCNYSSTLSVSPDKTISAAKNFYANGTTLSLNGTSGQWILKVTDLTDASNGFAEAYHSEISGCEVICNTGSSNTTDGTRARLVCLECDDAATGSAPNTNVDFDDFEITAAWTERDNSIRVEFNRPVRYYNATVQTLKFQNAEGTPNLNFTGLYSDPDCQNEMEYDTQMSYFYIKAASQNDSEYGAWNTDATGRSSGADDNQSTDRSGIHHENIPALDFARALINGSTTQAFVFTDRWGKRLNNYSSRTPTAKAAYGSTADTDTTHEVADKTGPVLYSVRTGQELHDSYNPATGEASEHSYDSHNFMEFVYSEKVDFDGSADDSTLNDSPATAENVKVNDSLGAVKGDITKEDNLQLAGLGILEHGLLHTGKNGSTDKYVSALYRKGTNAEYAIRLSIAGYTDPAVTLTDDDGYTYKKWIGYIEQATIPSGTVKHLVNANKKNERVKDKEGNVQIKYADDITTGEPVFDTIPVINSTDDGLYGGWDLSEPVFAIIRQKKDNPYWEQTSFSKNYFAEAIGNNSGVGSTLDRIEFHLYDNTPDFEAENQPEWFTEVGWCKPNSDGEKPQALYKSYSYAADIFGGARPFDNDASRRTSGGVRYSTVYSSVNAFKYGIGSNLSENLIKTSFDNSKIGIPGASSLIFTGTSSPRRSAGDSEGLYFALPLANTSLDIKTSFTVKYDDSVGFITDLAGNRLRTKVFSTIDRTPPSIDMTVCPVGGDELEIIFVKKLCVESGYLKYNDNTTGEEIEIPEQYDELITHCFDFITIDSSGGYHSVTDLTVDTTVPAVISIKENQNGSFFTSLKLKLSRTVTLDDIKNTFIRITYPDGYYEEYSVDLFTGHPGSRVTFIQDENGNNIQMYTAHALSDFAVGIINPLYAYDSAMTEDDGSIISDSLFRANTTDDVDSAGWSVHDWNRDQKNYGTLPAKRPVAIVADTTDGTEENENAPDSFRLYLANNPDADSVSTQYNSDLEPLTPWRIWLPNEMSGVFTALSEKNNTRYSQVDGTLLSDDISNRLIFDVGETITNQWAAGNQISFLFGLTNSDGTPVTIMHSPELDINHDKQYLPTSAKMPLFALRQTVPADLMSLDLWSFRLKDVMSQRGGVTILNNVINSTQHEKVVVKVNQPQQGNLTVLVMTLDGSIVDYLHRGTSAAGEHFYSWDGTNRRGRSVARGMYFIRVTGPGIDETRKVMVVKD